MDLEEDRRPVPQGVLGPVTDECLAGPASSVAKAPSSASLSVIQAKKRGLAAGHVLMDVLFDRMDISA